MSAKTTLPITEVRRRLFEITKAVRKPGVHYTITENGKPTVVIMSVDEFESWKETLDVIREMPTIFEDIKQAEKDYQNGNYITFDEYLKKRGFSSTAKKYAKKISTNSSTKGSKGSR